MISIQVSSESKQDVAYRIPKWRRQKLFCPPNRGRFRVRVGVKVGIRVGVRIRVRVRVRVRARVTVAV